MEPPPPAPPSSLETVTLRHGPVQAVWHLHGHRPPDRRVQVHTVCAGPLLLVAKQAVALTGSFDAASQGAVPFYGVLFQLAGQQVVDNPHHETLLAAGSILIWNSRVSSDFEFIDPVRVLQLLVPDRHFERRWPQLVPSGDWTVLNGQTALTTLARSSVETLWQHRARFEPSDLQVGIEAALDLLDQSLRKPRHAVRSKADLYEQVRHYITREIENPALDPSVIARHHGCSVRALHALFAAFDTTVAGSIRTLRLEQCRSALQEHHGERIGQVALRWGFSDAAHFSKLFKSTYGLSPRHFREVTSAAPT
ncbi:MAG: hypothetical protein RLZZ373_470 [Pseudomonadota bacterium]|jgi:AraC-like DNA-binding protein